MYIYGMVVTVASPLPILNKYLLFVSGNVSDTENMGLLRSQEREGLAS